MAFLIPDNLKSRRDIPEPIRRVAGAFQIALDEDVTVWYEPPYDPSGTKPHLVVLLPDRGVLVLEVLGIRAGAQSDRDARIERYGDAEECQPSDPIARARLLASTLSKRIARIGALRTSIRVSVGAVLPSTSRADAERKGARTQLDFDRCLFSDEIDPALRGDGETALLRVFAKILGAPLTNRLTSEEEKNLRGAIQPESVIQVVARTASPDQIDLFRPPRTGDFFRIMDRQQEAMAKALGDGHRVIRGVAGSGKTLVLTYRARLLSKLRPNSRVLVTCFTRTLASQLRDALRSCPNVEVVHLDRLMADVIRAARLKHPGYKGDDGGDKVAQAALKSLQNGAEVRYDAILLDEAQDFSTIALQFVVGLLAEGADDLVIVADAAQNIFRRKFSWKQAGIQAQGRTRILRTNYRNTREVLDFASRFLLADSTLRSDETPDVEDENVMIPPGSSRRTGRVPELYVEANVASEVTAVVRLTEDWAREGARPRKIAILYGAAREQKCNRPRMIYDQLRKAGVSVFWMSRDRDSKDQLGRATEPVVLSTIHSAKGIEFERVIVCGLWRKKEEVDSIRKLVYVGMTRATDELVVVTADGHALVPDLRSALGEEERAA